MRILNFRISVLGEVNRPGSFAVSGQRISIMEALGLAGDLTMKAKRENVLIVRDFNGTKTYSRINLTNKEVFNWPVYYLTQNDVVYVEPNHSAMSSSKVDARIGVGLSIAAFLLSLAILVTN